MNILVTGGAGFIGSHICHELIRLNHTVICVDNLSSGFFNNIKELFSHPNFTFYHEDILNLNEYSEVFSNIDAICHQAAIGSVPKSLISPELYHNNNVNMFFHILEIARKNNIKRFIYASSSSVYGNNSNPVKIEHDLGEVLSPYAATKYINETYAGVYNKCYNLETIGLRYFNVFGPKQNPLGDYAAVIPKFINLILNNTSPTINGDGSFSRDFTYIHNVVQANVLALTTNNELCFGQTFNIGTGGSTTILDLFYKINKYLKSDVKVNFGPIRKGDIPLSLADINKAKLLLSYIPTINIDQGLVNTIKYFKTK